MLPDGFSDINTIRHAFYNFSLVLNLKTINIYETVYPKLLLLPVGIFISKFINICLFATILISGK
jgi:hypothetical protein